jgi:nitroreductase
LRFEFFHSFIFYVILCADYSYLQVKEVSALEFYDVINARRTVRDFKSQSVDLDIVRKILAAGLKAPTNDHMRNWEFVVLTDKIMIEKVIKKIPKKVSDKRVDFILKSWRMTDECQRNMYTDAIPKQYEMLSKSECLILPLFKQKKNLLESKDLSALNAFASIWCCIENILLSSTAEGLGCAIRIPLGDEAEYIAQILKYPKEYMFPCYLAIGYPEDNTVLPKEIDSGLESKLHFNTW